jgi:hypothetical protein
LIPTAILARTALSKPRASLTTETIAQQTKAMPMTFPLTGQAQPGSTTVKNGPFIGFVTSLLVLIAVAVWQFSVLTLDARHLATGQPETSPLDSNQVKPALSRSPK